jgi:hypothetical protein
MMTLNFETDVEHVFQRLVFSIGYHSHVYVVPSFVLKNYLHALLPVVKVHLISSRYGDLLLVNAPIVVLWAQS